MREADPEFWGLLVWVFLPLRSPLSCARAGMCFGFQQLILSFVLFLGRLFPCGAFSSVVGWGLISILRVR